MLSDRSFNPLDNVFLPNRALLLLGSNYCLSSIFRILISPVSNSQHHRLSSQLHFEARLMPALIID